MNEHQQTIRFAQRMNQLPPYLFGMINKSKMEKRRRGDDVIDLGMGNPIDPAPTAVSEKLSEVARDPKTHRYPAADGLRSLRREIANRYRQDYGVELDSDAEVICTIGSKEGISHLCLALVGPGDTVLVPAPAFPVHIYAAIIAGGSVIRINLDEDEAFVRRIADMCSNVSPRPKLLILNYPTTRPRPSAAWTCSRKLSGWPNAMTSWSSTILPMPKSPSTATSPPAFWKCPVPGT